MHLCMDGSEPAAALHMDNDAGLHHVDERSHKDVDVSLSGDTLVKKADISVDLLVLLAALFSVFYFPRVRDICRAHLGYLVPNTAPRAHLRPLLRAPPL